MIRKRLSFTQRCRWQSSACSRRSSFSYCLRLSFGTLADLFLPWVIALVMCEHFDVSLTVGKLLIGSIYGVRNLHKSFRNEVAELHTRRLAERLRQFQLNDLRILRRFRLGTTAFGQSKRASNQMRHYVGRLCSIRFGCA